MLQFYPLVPLRIPSGWEVSFNNLVELPPVESLTAEDRDAYLSQDLLSLQSRAPVGTPSAGYVIAVGWRPDGDPAGSYRLHVIKESWSDIVVRFESVRLDVICEAIGLCASRLNEGARVDAIQAQLHDVTEP